MGDNDYDNNPSKVSDEFNGFPIPSKTLSGNFSMDSFVATLARLNNLKVLSLVSLGIWGSLPNKIDRLYSIEYLDFSSNFLFGSIPEKISTMSKIQTLKLNDNYLNGTFPEWFDSLSNLTVLNLTNNRLTGSFPSSIRKVGRLTDLLLSKNEISGKAPDLSSLHQLQRLDLSFNVLQGEIPAALFSLPNIAYLNVAANTLSGSLPNHLRCGGKLIFVNISDNRMTGELPACLSTQSDTRTVLYSGNCLSNEKVQQYPESHCLEEIRVEKKQSGKKHVAVIVIVIAVIGILILMVLLAFVFLIICRRYCRGAVSEQHLLHKPVQENSAAGLTSELVLNARFISQNAKLGSESFPACRPFTLEELKEATNTFHSSALIGEGSFGKLYKGRLVNGTHVAIRCLPSSKKYSIRNLRLRLDLLAKPRHPHLVCLLGHCIDLGGQDDNHVNKVFLVYEFLSATNFQAHITENGPIKVLDWPERLAVLISVAKAVQFLHTGVIPGFVNNRLKSNNILLNDHGIAKLSDYGLSIISEESVNEGVNGRGPKSCVNRQMTSLEDDVYSFGFILLESLVGPSVSTRREEFIKEQLEKFNTPDGCRTMISPVVLASGSQESLSTVISIYEDTELLEQIAIQRTVHDFHTKISEL
ncbi:hypothetical protein ACFE04_031940 [Oxalis oulophora]